MKWKIGRTQAGSAMRRRPRFRLDKLEERIAPKYNKNTKLIGTGSGHCSDTCESGGCGTGSY